MASLPVRVSTRALSRVCDAGREEAEAAGGAWRNLCARVLLLPWRCWRLESKANLGLILSLRRTVTWPPTPGLLPRVKTEMSPDIPQVSARRQNRPRLRLSAEPAVDTGPSPQIRDPGLEGLGALP